MATDKERRSAWQVIAMQPAWLECTRDLILFCCSELGNSEVRCGRLDVLAYIEDSIIGTPDTEEA